MDKANQLGNVPVLQVHNLTVDFQISAKEMFRAVDGISFEVNQGEILGIAGESGSGKSVTSYAILGLLPKTARVSGEVFFEGRQLVGERALKKIRGSKVTMIFQDPSSSLNPILTVGNQVREMLETHASWMPAPDMEEKIVELFRKVKITDPEKRIKSLPLELSGGMNQRVMIAMSLVASPRLVIADELTSALDVTTQAEVLDLLRDLVNELGISLVFITHNLGLIAEYADRVLVMHKGKIVEEGEVFQIFSNPESEYTRELMAAVPRLDRPLFHKKPEISQKERKKILEVKNLKVYFPVCGGKVFSRRVNDVKAVDDVSFSVQTGEIFGIVGESGCGKSTLARAILGIEEIKNGEIFFEESPLVYGKKLDMRRKIQGVFQDPCQSLDPKFAIGELVGEGIDVHKLAASKKERQAKIENLLLLVGIDPKRYDSYPAEFSGGQLQRIAIARALAVEPALLILDEPVSSLDVVVQRKILELLLDLRARLGLTYVFISHDLAVVREICDRVAVMYVGNIVEEGTAKGIYQNPSHPYTRALLSVTPIPDPVAARNRKRVRLQGEVPSPINPPSGCRFKTRCQFYLTELCDQRQIMLDVSENHKAACGLLEN